MGRGRGAKGRPEEPGHLHSTGKGLHEQQSRGFPRGDTCPTEQREQLAWPGESDAGCRPADDGPGNDGTGKPHRMPGQGPMRRANWAPRHCPVRRDTGFSSRGTRGSPLSPEKHNGSLGLSPHRALKVAGKGSGPPLSPGSPPLGLCP